MQTAVKALATFFYIGYLPGPKGTYASLAALLLYFLVRNNILIYGLVTLFLILLGFLVSGRAEEILGKKDAREITIDEAAGMLIALFLLPQTPTYIISAFFIYRIFDVLKVPPMDRIENLPGSAGIMLDDIVAALYTTIIMGTLHFAITYYGSIR